ncbi:alpha-D-glucose-1-phosphate cytidylyltransferase [alpha proteobacterium BAL199]|jgi:glucose-1-phosphate cytidylyltransferase|nr:alpha-D-glucose-1-phosphate cytidylyltransferase [alpha proteobacterium BAL199]
MKAVILAGGLGTRLAEETHLRPKPMIEIGGRPIIWHIMKLYSTFGVNDFVICCGYKGYMLKEFFLNYRSHVADVVVDMRQGSVEFLQDYSDPWRVTLVDTGDATNTGGRLRRVMPYVQDDECFCLTYGDGLADVDIHASIAFHRAHGRLATVTAVAPPGRYGALELDQGSVTGFREKPAGDGGLINGGFFVLSPGVDTYLHNDNTSWESEALTALSGDGQLMAFQHDGFWQAMDTLRDKNLLEALWDAGRAPWRTWQ